MTFSGEMSCRTIGSDLFSFFEEGLPGLAGRRCERVVTEISIPEISLFSPVEQERSTCQATKVFLSQWETMFTPRTDLGKRLYALRAKAVSAGMKLYSEEEVLAEVKRRRGEREE